MLQASNLQLLSLHHFMSVFICTFHHYIIPHLSSYVLYLPSYLSPYTSFIISNRYICLNMDHTQILYNIFIIICITHNYLHVYHKQITYTSNIICAILVYIHIHHKLIPHARFKVSSLMRNDLQISCFVKSKENGAMFYNFKKINNKYN